jgi:hypothetical protein
VEIVPKNVHWLLPEEPVPCDIFLHFRGLYAIGIPVGQPAQFKLLEKLAKAKCTQIYVRAQDQEAWNSWEARRYPGQESEKKKSGEGTQKNLYGNKRAELLSYVQKTITKKANDNPFLDRAFPKALELLQNVVQQPSLDWYFKQFHEPPDLFQHNARVAYGLAIFLQLNSVVSVNEMEAICYSALIHELEGQPAANMKTVVSQQTLSLLEKNQHPVPKEVTDLIELHDELCSGKGFPNNKKLDEISQTVRAFTLFNHFDTYRQQNKGTRRVRFEKTKATMEARRQDYDSAFWPLFWDFWETLVEPTT